MAVKQGKPPQQQNRAGKEKPLEEVKGDVKVDDKPPSTTDLTKAGKVEVFDAEGTRHRFADLVTDGEGRGKRVLVVFIRHFFCGQCQEYLRVLSLALPPSQLSSLPSSHAPTSLFVIGCGAPDMIAAYAATAQCPYPIYADPDRKLYSILRMTRTLNLGANPTYMHAGLIKLTLRSLVQELRAGRNMFRGGDYSQVGGEFLFESPARGEEEAKGSGPMDDVRVPWCHRMCSTRDHTPIDVTRKQLGLDGGDLPPRRRESKRFSFALGGAREGLGRRISSSKRMSWHAGAPADGSTEGLNGNGNAKARAGGLRGGASVKVSGKEESQERSIMEQLKEEGETTEASQLGQDREATLKKLTGGGPLKDGMTNAAEDRTEIHTSAASDDPVNSTPAETKVDEVPITDNAAVEGESFHEANEKPQTNGSTMPHGHADKVEQPDGDVEKKEHINVTGSANGHAVVGT